MGLEGNVRIQWVGTNFPEIYEWLICGSITRDFVVRIDEPGNSRSTIEIKIENYSLRLRLGDWIVKDESGAYHVFDSEYI